MQPIINFKMFLPFYSTAIEGIGKYPVFFVQKAPTLRFWKSFTLPINLPSVSHGKMTPLLIFVSPGMPPVIPYPV